MVSVINKLLKCDVVLYKFINKNLSNPYLFYFLNFITNIADVFTLSLVLYLIFGFIAKKADFKGRNKLVQIIAPVLITAIINILLKLIFQRSAPTPLAINRWPEFSLLPFNYAFPSGHTARAFALAISLSMFYPKKKWYLIAAACLIGFSRIYIGAHYPLDVLAGAILGTIIAWLFNRKVLRSF